MFKVDKEEHIVTLVDAKDYKIIEAIVILPLKQ